jgi:hypothetical protein
VESRIINAINATKSSEATPSNVHVRVDEEVTACYIEQESTTQEISFMPISMSEGIWEALNIGEYSTETASRIISQFSLEYGVNKIYAHIDLRWPSCANMDELNFYKIYSEGVRDWHVKGNNRYGAGAHDFKDEEVKTIWDCGHEIWLLEIAT